jgi:hypothetical protein
MSQVLTPRPQKGKNKVAVSDSQPSMNKCIVVVMDIQGKLYNVNKSAFLTMWCVIFEENV